jgi:hypothetical protein
MTVDSNTDMVSSPTEEAPLKVPMSGDIGSSFDGFDRLSKLAFALGVVSEHYESWESAPNGSVDSCLRPDMDTEEELAIRVVHAFASEDVHLRELDMSCVKWMDANMCAPLGAILERYRELGLMPSDLKGDLRQILLKNGFLRSVVPGTPRATDTYGTTVEYRRFGPDDAAAFEGYLRESLTGKGIPEMTPALTRKFWESLAELFDNAAAHSETTAIFVCGQHFPKKRKLDFSVADAGIGIRENILRGIGLNFTPEEAIQWAVSEQNTTRQREKGKPGGLGLKLIKDFIKLNGGTIQIASDAGYWRYAGGSEETRALRRSFPGTVVNIEINTADAQSYCLASEMDPSKIF